MSVKNVRILQKEGYEHFLPTFNSRAIESLLYKTPNLSEHFLSLNDDFILLNETKVTDFFSGNKPVLRGFLKIMNLVQYRATGQELIKMENNS